MASIQVLELRPVDAPVEELSYDEAGNILGGQDFNLETDFDDLIGVLFFFFGGGRELVAELIGDALDGVRDLLSGLFDGA